MGQHLLNSGTRLKAASAGPATGIAIGVRIATRAGFVPAGALRPGDTVLTRDSGYRPLRGIVPLGFMPCGAPDGSQLWLRPDHGILTRDIEGEEVLLPARRLFAADHPRLERHIVLSLAFDRHELLCTESGWIESAPDLSGIPARPRAGMPGPEAMRNFRVAGGGGRA